MNYSNIKVNYFFWHLIILAFIISMVPATMFAVGEELQYTNMNLHNGIEEKSVSNNILLQLFQVGNLGGLLRSLQYTIIFLVPAIILLTAFMIWSWSLKRQVDVKTRDLKQAQEQREQLLSTITHELRTPLVSIDGYIDLINTGQQGAIPEKVETYLKTVREESQRLLTLTDDLKDFRRLEFGKLQLDQQILDYHEVIDDCIKLITPLITKKRHQFKMNIPEDQLIINGDNKRLCQVLINLFSNAIKFTPESSEIIMQVENDSGNIKTKISDTGIGIRKEDLERVFKPFTKIKKPVDIEGTGLGLSIARGFVEAHGGKIWAESEGEGKGATFTFTIPEYKLDIS